MRVLYKYPQREYPYARLVEENARRGRERARVRAPRHRRLRRRPLLRRGGGVRQGHARGHPRCAITVDNRGPERRRSTCCPPSGSATRGPGSAAREPRLELGTRPRPGHAIGAAGASASSGRLPPRTPRATPPSSCSPRTRRTSGGCSATASPTPFVKDAFHEYVVHGRARPGQSRATRGRRPRPTTGSTSGRRPDDLRLRLADAPAGGRPSGRLRRDLRRAPREADEFYATVVPERLGEDARGVMRQALAGMLWSKQWYHYDVRRWLEGDPAQPPPPPERRRGATPNGPTSTTTTSISMPDKWEYPWYAAWDLAFHTIALALVDPDFAKDQLILFLREWYMHPNGQIPAYEWALGDVEPAGPRLGGLAGLQDREADPGRRRPAVPRAGLPQAAPELHLVGEPQGPRGEERLPGGLPRPRQHRGLRPPRAAARSAATSSSPTAPHGSGCTA